MYFFNSRFTTLIAYGNPGRDKSIKSSIISSKNILSYTSEWHLLIYNIALLFSISKFIKNLFISVHYIVGLSVTCFEFILVRPIKCKGSLTLKVNKPRSDKKPMYKAAKCMKVLLTYIVW